MYIYIYIFFSYLHNTAHTANHRCTCTFREHAQKKILEPDSAEMPSHSCPPLTSMPIDFIYPYLDK